MSATLQRALRRLGAAGVLGVGVLLACAGLWISTLQPLEKEVQTRHLAGERMRARTPYQPVSAGSRAQELRQFQALFPAEKDLTNDLERLHSLALGAGLELAQGEYRLERRPAGLSAYRITLPVYGSYPELRRFIGAVLDTMPAASIDALRFDRRRAADSRLEAQVRLTLHVRPAGDSP